MSDPGFIVLTHLYTPGFYPVGVGGGYPGDTLKIDITICLNHCLYDLGDGIL